MIRKARIDNIIQIHKMINQAARQELMLPRSLSDLYESLRDFWVYHTGKRLVGCCALRIVWQDLAEIRSLVVSKQYQRRGIGVQMVDAALREAKGFGCKSVFVLTYVPKYFKKFGFRVVNKDRLPHKIWSECINCPKFPDCKETALIKKL